MNLEDRIAVCFSGQIRTGIETAPYLKRFFGDLLPKMDFFIHTWDTDTSLVWNPETCMFPEPDFVKHLPVKADKFIKIREIYNPREMTVDNINAYELSYHQRVIRRSGLPPVLHAGMFQSLYESNSYKTEYEIENNSEYGLVIRIRFDIFFDPDHTLQEELDYLNVVPNKLYVSDFMKKLPRSVEDICWIAKSSTINTVCDFSLERETRSDMTVIDWQDHLRYYLYKHDIFPVKWKKNNLYIYRTTPGASSPFDMKYLK